jgi:hypothetical protein
MKSVEAMVKVLLGDMGDFEIVFVLGLSFYFIKKRRDFVYAFSILNRIEIYTEDAAILNSNIAVLNILYSF